MIEIDVKYVPDIIVGKWYYQYTAIDTASRRRYLKGHEEQTSFYSIRFLVEVVEQFPYRINALKTDNGSIFTNYYVGTNKRSDLTVKTIQTLGRFCAEHSITHYLIDPSKLAQNGIVERRYGEDQEEFYERNIFKNQKDLEKKIRVWNDYYNNLEYYGLD